MSGNNVGLYIMNIVSVSFVGKCIFFSFFLISLCLLTFVWGLDMIEMFYVENSLKAQVITIIQRFELLSQVSHDTCLSSFVIHPDEAKLMQCFGHFSY